MTTNTKSREIPNKDVIIIERRDIVGEIVLDPYGTTSPLVAAYTYIAEYMSENDGQAAMSLEFNLYGRTFRAAVNEAPVDVRS